MAKEFAIKDLSGILVILSVIVINHKILENVYIMKIVGVKKIIIDKLVEECSENIDGNDMLYNETLNAIPLNIYKKACNSCMVYI